MREIRVRLPGAAESEYGVRLEAGALAALPELLREHAPAGRYAIVSDSNVAPLHAVAVRESLSAAGVAAELFVHEAGEAAKTRASWGALTDALLGAGFGRDATVVAVGGGVTGDLAGFVAATYLRGIPVVQVPTSLLAMVDASVGGKTGVDTSLGKNLVGAFHPPRLVLIDPLVLRTLPVAELRSGAAEVIKHGAIADAAYLERAVATADALLNPATADPVLLTDVIGRSVEIKAAVVSRDPFEQGERAVLNFGHTLGHALELLSGYRTPHGHAVAVGMVLAARLGEALGVTRAGTALAIGEAVRTFGLPDAPGADVAPERLLAAARTDKKARDGQLRFVLLEELGRVAGGADGWTRQVAESAVVSALPVV